MRVDLHPEARVELRSTALWYEERREGLGVEFIAGIDSALLRVTKAPKSFPRWVGAEKASAVIRKASVARFPYVIAFEEHKRHALVLAVAHQKRRPLYWLTRTSRKPG